VKEKLGTPRSKVHQLTPKNLSSSRSEKLFTTNTTKSLKTFKANESKFGMSPKESPKNK